MFNPISKIWSALPLLLWACNKMKKLSLPRSPWIAH